MAQSSVSTTEDEQIIRIPKDFRFHNDVKEVWIRKEGADLVLTPIHQTWDSFFLADDKASEDFLPKRASQHDQGREPI